MLQHFRERIGAALGVAPLDVHLALRPPLSYQSNRLYDAYVADRHYMVKEFLKPAEFAEAPVREFEGLQLVSSLDVAPQPLLWQPHSANTRPFVVYEFMEGEMWDRRRPSSADLEQLSALWLVINSRTGDRLWISRSFEMPLSAQLDWFAGVYHRYGEWAEANFPPGSQAASLCLFVLQERAAVILELSEETPPLRFCRADARFANVIARPDGRLGLVDWEDCGLRDPALDLADIITAPNQEDLLTWDDWQPFVQPYLQGHVLQDTGLERRMQLYLALLPLAWLGWLLRAAFSRAQENQLQDWESHQMPANQRLRRYLARASAWPNLDFNPELEELEEIRFFPEG